MKVTNQRSQNADINSVKNKKSNSVDGLENLGRQTKSVANDLEKVDAAKIALSDRAQDMKKIKEIALKAPDVNMDKVKKFQALVDSGQYKVDSGKVADKMVDSHLMMGFGEEE